MLSISKCVSNGNVVGEGGGIVVCVCMVVIWDNRYILEVPFSITTGPFGHADLDGSAVIIASNGVGKINDIVAV